MRGKKSLNLRSLVETPQAETDKLTRQEHTSSQGQSYYSLSYSQSLIIHSLIHWWIPKCLELGLALVSAWNFLREAEKWSISWCKQGKCWNTRDFSSREEGEAEIIPPPMVENKEGQGMSAGRVFLISRWQEAAEARECNWESPHIPEPQRGERTCCRNQQHDLRRASVTKRKSLKLELNFCVHFRCFTTVGGSFALAICQGPHVAHSPTLDPVRGIKVPDWVCSNTLVRLALE